MAQMLQHRMRRYIITGGYIIGGICYAAILCAAAFTVVHFVLKYW